MTQGAFSPSPSHQPQPRFGEPYSDDSPTPQHHYTGSLSNAALPSTLSGRRVDEFGSPADNSGARFATFPVKARSPSSGGEPGQFSLIATPPPDHVQSDSFSSSVAQALAASAPHEPAPGRLSKDGPAPSYDASVHKSSPPDNSPSRRQSEQIVEEEDGRHVRFDATSPESSPKPVGQGPQTRLARLLQNEEEGMFFN